MITLIRLPAVNPNDERGTIIAWLKEAGVKVRKGENICEIETSKATVELTAEADGYLVHLAAPGDSVPVGKPVAAVTETAGEDVAAALKQEESSAEKTGGADERRWTKKAFIVARRTGVDLETLAARNPGKTLTEEDVLAAQSEASGPSVDLTEREFPDSRPERVLLLGGAGGAGAIAIDAMRRGTGKQRPAAILDNNPKAKGMTSMGVPILGPLDMIDELWQQQAFDAAVILFTDDVKERQAHFERLTARGIRFTNLIDPSVQLRSYVRMGVGNVIMANCFFALGVSLGDNNFFASHTVVEHHSTVGSHCAIGPRCTTSGRVQIGDRVRFGMQVAIEPYLKIGSDSVVASGIALTSHVPERTIVKSHAQYTTREA
ncbi:biotin/lipoyl-containing protein [Dongia sedimenti]|uniref:Biotin/lipoyl-containing protein n=1 Tax=Dongia sedimenti TaxID=3064282 RepID=A0ABU0YHH0_9PROT|nr:biotin/lipoyl-containing protein [Rhodospirillaceae bacterium R-7]